MTKLFQQKEWLSFDDALRYASAITKEEITEKDLLPVLLEKKVSIRIMQKNPNLCFGCESSNGYLFFSKNSSHKTNLNVLTVDFDELNKNSWQVEDGYMMPLDGKYLSFDFELDLLSVRHIGYFYNREQYDYEPVVLDVAFKDTQDVVHATLYFVSLNHNNQDESSQFNYNQCHLIRLSWDRLLSKTHKFRGHIGLDGAFIKPYFNRMEIDKLLFPDAIDNQEILLLKQQNDELKLKILDLERKLSKRIDVREQTTCQNLIVALLDYIKGESAFFPEKHQSFENVTKLIDLIDDKYKGYDGLTKSNLSRKIPAIEKWFNQQ
jgi:hypothetical protein